MPPHIPSLKLSELAYFHDFWYFYLSLSIWVPDVDRSRQRMGSVVYRRQTDCGAWADVAPSLALFTNRPNFMFFLFSPSYILFLVFSFTKSESTTLI
jgi:hypothetical protein